MSEPTLLESRVDKIERDNRRLKLTVGALLLALAAVPLIGAVMPEQIPELIQARNFQVIDESGTVRTEMHWNGIFIRAENGRTRTLMNVGGIFNRDENGDRQFAMDDEGFQYHDQDGVLRAVMGTMRPGRYPEFLFGRPPTSPPHFSLYDIEGNVVWSTDCAPNC